MRVGREHIREFPSVELESKRIKSLNVDIQDDTILFKVDTHKIHYQPPVKL